MPSKKAQKSSQEEEDTLPEGPSSFAQIMEAISNLTLSLNSQRSEFRNRFAKIEARLHNSAVGIQFEHDSVNAPRLSQARGQIWSPSTFERPVALRFSAVTFFSKQEERQTMLQTQSVQIPDNSSLLDAPRVRSDLVPPSNSQTMQLSLFPETPGEEASSPMSSLPLVVLPLSDSGFLFPPPMVTLHHTDWLAMW